MPNNKATRAATRAQEEELFARELSNAESTTGASAGQQSVYLILGAAISVLPAWVAVGIMGLNLTSWTPLLIGGIALSAFILSLAYQNSSAWLSGRLAGAMDGNFSKKHVKNAKDKSASLDAMQKTLTRKIVKESVAYSVLYTNSLYVLVSLFFSFFLLRNSEPYLNYALTSSFSAGLVWLISTAKPKTQ